MKLKIKIPTSWDKLSDRQFFKVAALLNSGKSGLLFDYRLLRVMMDIRFWNIVKIIKLHVLLSQVPLSEIKKSYTFIYEESGRTKFPEIPKIKGYQYFSPIEKLSNISVYEFAVADDLHIKFRQTKNVQFLSFLAAVLYVSQKQPRPIFDKNNLEELEPIFRKLPLDKLIAIEIVFAGCKEYLATKFKHAFPKPKKGTPAKAKSRSGSNWSEIILKMAGGKFGNLHQTRQTDLYAFLAEFDDNLKNPPKNV